MLGPVKKVHCYYCIWIYLKLVWVIPLSKVWGIFMIIHLSFINNIFCLVFKFLLHELDEGGNIVIEKIQFLNSGIIPCLIFWKRILFNISVKIEFYFAFTKGLDTVDQGCFLQLYHFNVVYWTLLLNQT